MSSVYLGLDVSTQSLSGLCISLDTGSIELDVSINFGECLPQYNSPNGFILNSDSLVRHADPCMWLDALEMFLERGTSQGFDWSRVVAISGSGQQHGSVYLNSAFPNLKDCSSQRSAWAANDSLSHQIRPMLSRGTSPIWMDASTCVECDEISNTIGGAEKVASIAGSRPTERLTGPQIRKFFKYEREAFMNTSVIHLVSSFFASILCGGHCPIDTGDGAGMLLMNIRSGTWNLDLVNATAESLIEKLPPIVKSGSFVGILDGYFSKRYGFNPHVRVIAWTGDNPSSLIGLGASFPGTAVMSLGTSDTYFVAVEELPSELSKYGIVFGNPAGGFMVLVCFRNGSLARDAVREKLGLSWKEFESIISNSPSGNNGNVMIPFFFTEITPTTHESIVCLEGQNDFKAWKDIPGCARGVVEGQMLNIRLHSEWLGLPSVIRAAGGASQNRAILQIAADVFGANVIQLPQSSNSAALGAALRAAHCCLASGVSSEESQSLWRKLYTTFISVENGTQIQQSVDAHITYTNMIPTFAKVLYSVVPS